QPNPNEFFGLM
uniref:Substance P-like peptide 2 n=1 Tax=Pseudophryne guentheri TaxID=30349 RepID=TKN5_PSEGU|nr:RecName: Full=Substance P-like peptide 2; AltName: Full=PG-SPII [Pseudophryne guentheri]